LANLKKTSLKSFGQINGNLVGSTNSSHYTDCLIIILGIGNPTYTPMTDAKEEILDNHRRDLCSFGISTKDEELDLPSLY
jgi:hypothetical protein